MWPASAAALSFERRQLGSEGIELACRVPDRGPQRRGLDLDRDRLGSPARPLARPAGTQREREVLALIAEGHSNRAIGERLFLSHKTVEAHISQIFLKLDLGDSPERHRRVLAVLTYLRSS